MSSATIAIRTSNLLVLSTAEETVPPLPSIPDLPEIYAQRSGALVELGEIPPGDACGDENIDILGNDLTIVRGHQLEEGTDSGGLQSIEICARGLYFSDGPDLRLVTSVDNVGLYFQGRDQRRFILSPSPTSQEAQVGIHGGWRINCDDVSAWWI